MLLRAQDLAEDKKGRATTDESPNNMVERPGRDRPAAQAPAFGV